MLREKLNDGVRWLTFDRPERLNSFQVADYRDLRVAIERASRDSATRVLVLTGNGRAFSAGADLSLIDGTATRAERADAGVEFSGMLNAIGGCAQTRACGRERPWSRNRLHPSAPL
jgi:enoyl-CoA hydratase/carnithine racemase